MSRHLHDLVFRQLVPESIRSDSQIAAAVPADYRPGCPEPSSLRAPGRAGPRRNAGAAQEADRGQGRA